MKKSIKLLMTAVALTVFLSLLALSAYAETAAGHFEYTYNGGTIVNNDWTLDRNSGLLTIKSVGGGYNECGTGQPKYDKYGGWSKYNQEIKKVVLDGNFSKISNNAFKDCKNLEEIIITTGINQIDYDAFNGCSSLKSVSISGYYRVDGMADLRNVVKLSKNILKDTAIESVFTASSETLIIEEEALPKNLKELYGIKGATAELYAKENGIKFSERHTSVDVDIYLDGTLYNSMTVAFGSTMKDFGVSGKGNELCLFTDKELTTLCDTDGYLLEDTVFYGKEILSFSGWSIRLTEYKGLRAIFEYDIESAALMENAEIYRVGAIAGAHEYALSDFTENTPGTRVITVYEDGKKVGPTLGAPENGKVSFAVAAVGFEGTEDEFLNRATENIVFRGFVTVRNKKTGELSTVYTDARGSTLAYISKNYLESEGGKTLKDSERAFAYETVEKTLGKGEDARYDKNTLLKVLTDIYNDNGKILVGEEINVGETAAYPIEQYMNACGEAPSILGMDLACYGAQLMSCTENYKNDLLKSLIDYCRDGGVITASSHFQNPTGNWTSSGLCRGFLGEENIWEELVTPGTPLNRDFVRELNVDAAFLRELDNNDIPILWRPYHEMNGGWFWWCLKQENGYLIDSRSFTELWKYTYNYYENVLGLKNLVWVYSPNNDTGGLVDVDYGYPGDAYVDMTGLDWYSNGKYEIGEKLKEGVTAYDKMMAHGMPVALTEYGGSGGELDALETWEDLQKMYRDGKKLTYILTWTSDHSFPKAGKLDEFMAKPDTLSLKDIWNIFKEAEK